MPAPNCSCSRCGDDVLGYLIMGAGALLCVLWAVGRFTGGDPKLIAKHMRKIGGWSLLAFAAFLAMRGNYGGAAPLAMVALSVLGISGFGGFSNPFATNTAKSSGGRSSVRTRFVEMSLDHDSGEMDGTVLAGSAQGQKLSTLALEPLLHLRREVAADHDSISLVEAYLDRRFAGWREHVDHDANARQGGAGASNAMTQDEAYQILGLQPGADAEEIRRAHRALMKKVHPDQGGSTWLASKLNEAKDLLLATHR